MRRGRYWDERGGGCKAKSHGAGNKNTCTVIFQFGVLSYLKIHVSFYYLFFGRERREVVLAFLAVIELLKCALIYLHYLLFYIPRIFFLPSFPSLRK